MATEKMFETDHIVKTLKYEKFNNKKRKRNNHIWYVTKHTKITINYM